MQSDPRFARLLKLFAAALQTFSTGLSSGEKGGGVISVMLFAANALCCRAIGHCIRTRPVCTPGATAKAISARCSFFASVLAWGSLPHRGRPDPVARSASP